VKRPTAIQIEAAIIGAFVLAAMLAALGIIARS